MGNIIFYGIRGDLIETMVEKWFEGRGKRAACPLYGWEGCVCTVNEIGNCIRCAYQSATL